ncbi:glycosyl transferase family 28 [Acidimicrobiaceae bacterium USS-CC1]|uniref:Glycosyl transferase family 28 n=1 Tax=Acidiferrimicrobium australe TaxID=2664430 RepID=A0ABW9QQC3_9ACTN|nr:glycosyl transferase family 28 [Acidiferrimicrobium australe]
MTRSRNTSIVFVASTGGHLVELLALSERLPVPADEALWVTFDTPQSRSLLSGRDVRFVRYAGPRDVMGALVNAAAATRIVRSRPLTHAFSTGASIAGSFLPVAAAHGIEAHYLESATRILGPSLTGRLLRLVPGVHLHSQSPAWADGTWPYAGSVFDGFVGVQGPPTPVRRVVVTVGSLAGFGFRRLVERLMDILPPDADVTWQIGATDVAGLGITRARATLPAHELQAELCRADVVVAHAGVGTALSALVAGRTPLLVPREQAYGEHVDDHQSQIASELQARGLAVARRVSDLDASDLVLAGNRRVQRAVSPPPLDLATLTRRRRRPSDRSHRAPLR